MSDPAVEAARRYAATLAYGFHSQLTGADLIFAAREALAPLRELHQPVNECCDECGGSRVCCECEWQWPCATAKLIYREDEL